MSSKGRLVTQSQPPIDVLPMVDPDKELDKVMLRSLPFWQILLLERSLGLHGVSRMSDKDIALTIGETPRHVRLIRNEAIRTLQSDPEVCRLLKDRYVH